MHRQESFDQAVEIADKARQMFIKLGGDQQANEVKKRMELYKKKDSFQIALPNDEVNGN